MLFNQKLPAGLATALIMTVVLLAGCQHYMYGMPASEYNLLTPEQQKQAIANYNQQMSDPPANPSFNNAIGFGGSLTSNAQRFRSQAAVRR